MARGVEVAAWLISSQRRFSRRVGRQVLSFNCHWVYQKSLIYHNVTMSSLFANSNRKYIVQIDETRLSIFMDFTFSPLEGIYGC